MIRVLVDSSSDYTQEEIKEKGLAMVSLMITLAGKSYKGGVDLEGDRFYELMEETGEFPKTSQPSPQDFLDIFREVKEQGDELICILLSSSLSGTYQSATLAKSMVEYEKIYLIDSLTATHMIRVLTEYTLQRIQEGVEAAVIVEKLEQLKSHVKVAATVDTLEYLCKGGRVSRATAAIGEVARIKPLITVNEEGEVSVWGKALGKNKAIGSIMKLLESKELNPEFPLYSLYTYGTENCEAFEQRLEKDGYHPQMRLQVGATIGTHVGPGVFGVVYVEK